MIDPALHVDGIYIEEHPSDRPGAPVVVLVHGVFDSCDSFAAVVETFTTPSSS